MLPINITTKTKTTFSSLSSSTTMGKVQSDSWTNETPWGKIAQFSQGRYKSALRACQRNFNDQSQQKWKPGGRIKKINMSKLWSAGKRVWLSRNLFWFCFWFRTCTWHVFLLSQTHNVVKKPKAVPDYTRHSTENCYDSHARPLSSFSSTKMRSFSKCYGPKVFTKRLTFLRTNIIFKPGCDNFFVFL